MPLPFSFCLFLSHSLSLPFSSNCFLSHPFSLPISFYLSSFLILSLSISSSLFPSHHPFSFLTFSTAAERETCNQQFKPKTASHSNSTLDQSFKSWPCKLQIYKLIVNIIIVVNVNLSLKLQIVYCLVKCIS
jgi:hypothetical protein